MDRLESQTSVVLASGGIDSTVAIADQIRLGRNVIALTINYGQRHTAELGAATRIVQWYQDSNFPNKVRHEIINLPALGAILDSTLTRPDRPIPKGHYAASSMSTTIVPNRNMIFLSIAAGLAESIGAESVVIGCHAGDHHIYPDCRPNFIEYARACVHESTERRVKVIAPYINKTKDDIVKDGLLLNAPLHLTWSCYQTPDGSGRHCGKCGTCIERKEAFEIATSGLKEIYLNYTDPTNYAI